MQSSGASDLHQGANNGQYPKQDLEAWIMV